MKTRRSYVILVAISILFSMAAYFAGLNSQTNNNKKFCQLVAISNSHPLPSEPKTNDSSVNDRAWAMYNAYVIFGKELGCPAP